MVYTITGAINTYDKSVMKVRRYKIVRTASGKIAYVGIIQTLLGL